MLCETTCGVILSGGKSRRMGEDKPFIPFGGQNLIERVTAALSSVFSEVIIVASEKSLSDHRYEDLPFRVISDHIKNIGPIGGIETALLSVSDKNVFVAAADMPFLNPKVIRAMLPFSSQYDLVMPEINGRCHPLHAFYSQNCLSAIQTRIKREHLAPHRLKDEVKSYIFPESYFRAIDPKLHSVLNINTPEDLVSARLNLKTT